MDQRLCVGVSLCEEAIGTVGTVRYQALKSKIQYWYLRKGMFAFIFKMEYKINRYQLNILLRKTHTKTDQK